MLSNPDVDKSTVMKLIQCMISRKNYSSGLISRYSTSIIPNAENLQVIKNWKFFAVIGCFIEKTF